jgi:hypothetical protein
MLLEIPIEVMPMPVLLPSFLGRKSRAASRREMLSLARLDDHLMRDIGLRPTSMPSRRSVPVPRAARERRVAGPSS